MIRSLSCVKRRRREPKRPKPRSPTPAAPPSAESAEVERLRRENERLRRQNADQAKQITELKRQLALRQQNSTITSKPPSSDGLAGQQRPRDRRVKSRRKPCGQPGHPGRHRPLVPAERVDAIVDLAPDTCRHCAHPVARTARSGRATPTSSHGAPAGHRAHHGVPLSSAAVPGVWAHHAGRSVG